MFKPIIFVFVTLGLRLPAFAQQAAPANNAPATETAAPSGKAATLEAQAAALSAAGKTAAAGAAYMKAGHAYLAEGNNAAASADYAKAADLFEKQAHAGTQKLSPPNVVNPAPPHAAPPARPLKLTPLAPKPGFIIGRAVFEDGRLIEDFSVMASGQLYGQANAEGKHGYYELPMQKGLLITHIIARAHLSYLQYPWTLELQPTQPIAFGGDPWSYNGNADAGIVRDFVLKMDGPKPNYSDQDTVEFSLNNDAHSYRYGANLSVSCSYGNTTATDYGTGLLRAFPGSHVILTLSPTADPRIDGSVSSTPIVREFPVALSVNVYGIPIGLYQATARLREPNGTMHDLRLSTAGPYETGWQASLQPSVPVAWRKPTFAGSNPNSPILHLVK